MIMEGYLEFIVYGSLNIYTKDMSSNGEIIGLVFASICIFLAALFLPKALLWAIATKGEK
jgi:hypothetical protein